MLAAGESIDGRIEIRRAILEGRVDEARSSMDRLFPGLLDRRPRLVMRLEQQAVLDAISDGKWPEALARATSRLAPLADRDRSLLPVLEDTMVLFAFADPAAAPDTCFGPALPEATRAESSSNGPHEPAELRSRLSATEASASAAVRSLEALRHRRAAPGEHMLSRARRAETAAAVNMAILEHAGQASSSRLVLLLSLLEASQQRLESHADFRMPALRGAALVRGGLPEGDWAEAEECARAEVAAASLLAEYARDTVATSSTAE